MKHLVLLGCAALALAGCSTIVEGRSQSININTNPAGADCALKRQGGVIGRVNPTPGAALIEKSKHDISIECSKAGYQTASFNNHSDVAGATVGNVLIGGLIGWGIDSATGADNKYDGNVNITLVPDVAATTPSASLAPTTPGDNKSAALTN